MCRCISAEHGDNELELGHDEILADGMIKKGIKAENQLEVAIGDGMEFTIHGDLKNNKPKKSKYLNNATVNLGKLSSFKQTIKNDLLYSQKRNLQFLKGQTSKKGSLDIC